MPISPQIRKNWVATQKKFDHPVNAIGVKISPNDKKTMQVWLDEKIDEDGRISAEFRSTSKEIVPVKSNPDGEKGLTYRGVRVT